MSVFSGDFLGITLGEVHSSQLNITRVSSGDRYDDNLLPNFKDTTAEVPGGDGMYYWNTFYSQKPFVLNFAYDDLRDEDLRRLRQVFGFKGVQPLIFDEFPYKKYMVKCVSPPSFKYICFDHMEMRLYKGEGQANLVAYYPYALATFSPTITNATTATINNIGDLDAQLKIYYTINNAKNLKSIKILNLNGSVISQLNFNNITAQGNDKYILIDSTTHLVEGLDANLNKTGHLYNKFIISGDFFNAPLGRSTFQSNTIFYKMEYTPIYY